MCFYRLEAEKADLTYLWVSEYQNSELRQNFRGAIFFAPAWTYSMNSDLEHSFPTGLLLQHLKDLDFEYLWQSWHDVRACEAENELVQPKILMQAGRPLPSCAVLGLERDWAAQPWLPAELLGTGTKRESPPDSTPGFLPRWHRHRELCFTFRPLWLNESYCYRTPPMNSAESAGCNLGNTCAEPAPGSSPSRSWTWRRFPVLRQGDTSPSRRAPAESRRSRAVFIPVPVVLTQSPVAAPWQGEFVPASCHSLSGRAQAALSLSFSWQQTGLTRFLSLKWCRVQIPLIHLTSSLVFSQRQS